MPSLLSVAPYSSLSLLSFCIWFSSQEPVHRENISFSGWIVHPAYRLSRRLASFPSIRLIASLACSLLPFTPFFRPLLSAASFSLCCSRLSQPLSFFTVAHTFAAISCSFFLSCSCFLSLSLSLFYTADRSSKLVFFLSSVFLPLTFENLFLLNILSTF
jgi:hypothetical protein